MSIAVLALRKETHNEKGSTISCSATRVAPLRDHKFGLPLKESRLYCPDTSEHIRPGMLKVKWSVTQAQALPERYGVVADH